MEIMQVDPIRVEEDMVDRQLHHTIEKQSFELYMVDIMWIR